MRKIDCHTHIVTEQIRSHPHITVVPGEVTEMLRDGRLSTGHAKVLLGLDSPDLQKAAAVQKTQDGSYRGAVTSVSSGRESVSYANVGEAASGYAKAAESSAEMDMLLKSITVRYLANVPDANGVNLLYAGEVHGVPRHSYSV